MSTPTLTDDRVEAMRGAVMHAVERDVARRGRRARRAGGVVAACVLVLGTGTLGLSLLDTGSHDTVSGADSRALPGGASAEKDSSSDSAGDEAGGNALDQDRDVVTTGEVTLTTRDPRVVAQRISTYVESIGGRVDTRTESGSGDDASAFVTVRVPSTKVTATLDTLRTYGTVEDVSLQHDDVTAAAKDLDARIDALRLSIDRLERIMADADSSAELIKAETALTQRQEQLESLVAQRQQIRDRVSLSTLSIDVSQTSRPDAVEPGGFTGGLTTGWNALVSTLNHVVEVAGALLPWAAIAVAAWLAARVVRRRR